MGRGVVRVGAEVGEPGERARYKPVAVGFGTLDEARQYANRLAVAEEQPEAPTRPMGKRK